MGTEGLTVQREYPREVTGHEVNDANKAIVIRADERTVGNASHHYLMNYTYHGIAGQQSDQQAVSFQEGPIKEVGVNGVTNEALLAIVRDRLQGFQAGPFACRENALALTKIEEALHWLLHRTRERQSRGVEGTNQQ